MIFPLVQLHLGERSHRQSATHRMVQYLCKLSHTCLPICVNSSVHAMSDVYSASCEISLCVSLQYIGCDGVVHAIYFSGDVVVRYKNGRILEVNSQCLSKVL